MQRLGLTSGIHYPNEVLYRRRLFFLPRCKSFELEITCVPSLSVKISALKYLNFQKMIMVKGDIGTKALKPTVSWELGCVIIMPVSPGLLCGPWSSTVYLWHEFQKSISAQCSYSSPDSRVLGETLVSLPSSYVGLDVLKTHF